MRYKAITAGGVGRVLWLLKNPSALPSLHLRGFYISESTQTAEPLNSFYSNIMGNGVQAGRSSISP
jgi:hypothetical protein